MLPTITPRPFGFCGGMPMHVARWVATHAIDGIEAAPQDGHYAKGIRLKAGDEHIDTIHTDMLHIGASTLPDGRMTLVSLDGFIARQIMPIIEWENANPREKRYGVEGRPLWKVAEQVAHLILMGPEGAELVDRIDEVLAKADQSRLIESLREAVRKDPNDANGVSSTILRALPLETAEA